MASPTNLQYLFLYSNQITGTLPGSWSNLSNLQRINIENNQLTGTIPDSWSGLLNLKGLSLGWNQLTGILPVSWSALVNMEDLILSGNQFTGNLPGSWSSMVNLRSISLYYNQLTGSLPDSWSSMVYLYHINIGNNQLTGVLPDSWSSMVNMGSLHFYNNMISGDFPASWSSMIYWWYFNLDNNRISGLPDLSTFSRPGYLYIKQNSLDFGDIEPNIGIPQYFFGYNPQAPVGETRTVSLLAGQEFRTSVSVGGSSNQYTWYKNDIPVPMSNSPEFVIPSVVYDDNGVYKCSITNTVATDLTLWSNPVTLVLPELPVNETDSLALVALYNQCNGINWTKKANWLTGRVSTWEGVTVENQRVVKLDLGGWPSVGLTGTIPSEIANLTEIRWLSFMNNQLTGVLPTSWSALVNLEYLYLFVNPFTGTLPASWSALVNLKWLEMGSNQLSGALPESWSALVNLETLWLPNNQFSGTLPDSWSAMTKLWQFNVQNNQLSGTLPNSWSSLTGMTYFYIDNNQFTGTIPESWSSWTMAYAIGLNINQLSGGLPLGWSSDLNLRFLSLAINQFSVLPNLSALTNLERLLVQGNNLDFGDIEPNIGGPNIEFSYSPQAPIGVPATIQRNPGAEFRVSVSVGGTSNRYQWYKNGVLRSGATGSELVIPSVTFADNGIYTCQITNTVATGLTLTSQPVTLSVTSSNAEIYAFSFSYSACGCDLSNSIDPLLQRILIVVPYTVDISNLAPSMIQLEPGATVSPGVGVPQNWTLGPINYTVTASDGTTQKIWSVKVENPACANTDISSWTFANSVQTAWRSTIDPPFYYITVKPGTDLTSLSASVVLGCGASITTIAGEPFPATLDFSVNNPQKFRVIAQDGTSKVWNIQVQFADWVLPVVTTWNVSANNCTDSVAVQSTETGRVFIVNQSAINMAATPYPTCLYNLADWSGSGSTSVNMLVANRMGAWSVATIANTPVYVKTNGLFSGTYWAFAVDNAGNVSQISSVNIDLTRCDMDVSDLCNLRSTGSAVWRYRLTGEVFVSYEESRAGGNIKYVQNASCGILITQVSQVQTCLNS